MPVTPPQTPARRNYANEGEGQFEFFAEFGIDPEKALVLNTDGVWNGNLLEFKLNISDVNQVLFQAVKYLAKLRLNGCSVPANILLVDLNAETIYRYDAEDYRDAVHSTYASSASRENQGFRAARDPEVIKGYYSGRGQRVRELLRERRYVPVDITADCVVAWAERFYREVHGSDKAAFLNNDPKKGPLGELRDPRHFRGLITPYQGADYEEFSHILDRLNDKLKKIELGAFYTPDAYVTKAHELLRDAIARVPEGNDYVVIDRCAGTGNLERFLDTETLSHFIVNTYEQFEYLELLREFGDKVRAIIPPTYREGDPRYGMLLNGDALSDRFVLGVPDPQTGERIPNAIQKYLEDPKCTIILFENPPYAEVAGMEAQKTQGRDSFGWKSSYVKQQMAVELTKSENGTKAVNELSNLFIWSAFRYYLRQPTDSYVVFSPAKYFKSQGLIDRAFIRGFLVNRRHFHATKDAGVSIVLWSHETEMGRQEFPLEVFDIGSDGTLHAGAVKADFKVGSGNITETDDGTPVVTVRTTRALFSTLYDTRVMTDDEGGIVCEMNGAEAFRPTRGNPVYNDDILGYLVAGKASFENTDLSTLLTRCAQYNGNGFYLRRDNFLTKLPLFVAGRFPSEGRFWVRGVVNRCADNGDNFSDDPDFLKACLIYTALAYHNKCRSFRGSDGRDYRNELCLDAGTEASKALEQYTLTEAEKGLVKQWDKVLDLASKTVGHQDSYTYGVYQIDVELNTKRTVQVNAKRNQTVYDYPLLNGEIKTLRTMLARYHADVITPKLWEFGLLK